jgi:hypothetical protein
MKTVIQAFTQGKPRKGGNLQSDGVSLYQHGRKIASWKIDGLEISNGGYQPDTGATGSVTTKKHLNSLPGVRISQYRYRWTLNGEQWDGRPVTIPVPVPDIDTKKAGTAWVTDTVTTPGYGYNYYTRPVFAVIGCNDTGGWSDSPCPTDTATDELSAIKAALLSVGIKSKEQIEETSNVFCIRRFLIVQPCNFERATEIVDAYLENNTTRLVYKP